VTFEQENWLLSDTLLTYRCVLLKFSTKLFTETTQIWGKEFRGCMVFMGPWNSYFLLNLRFIRL
jgi:membrane-bound acyltransferase YfiQ involved in biofilm formation